MTYFKVAALVSAIAYMSPISAVDAHDSPEHSLEAARVAAMQQTTQAFLVLLTNEQRDSVVAALDDSAARTNWSNLPASMAPRSGMPVADMSGEQRRAFHAMLTAGFSSQGYLKTTTSMWHEDILREMTGKMVANMPDENPDKAFYRGLIESYDSEKFFVSIFGDPGSKDWGWMVTGHHYTANFTVADGKIAFMPLFLGASPQLVLEGRYSGVRLLQHESDRAFALIGSLEPSQLLETVVADAVDDDVFAGPGNRDGFAQQVGIRASSLNPLQLRLLNGVIDEYLDDASDEASMRQRKTIAIDGLGKLFFAWWGPTDNPAARYMFRVHGPSILIDYVREKSSDGGYNHVHSIARDPSNDYGSEWLKHHYEEAH